MNFDGTFFELFYPLQPEDAHRWGSCTAWRLPCPCDRQYPKRFAKDYREAQCFFEDIFEATQTGKRKKLFKFFCDSDLLVIDDLFLKKRLPETAADDLLDVILERYRRRKSTLITSNRPVEDWGKMLGDNAAASAILDRLLHRGHLLKFEGVLLMFFYWSV
ncbi:ATP-binding protein [Thermodesulfobacteriota bacterium]